MVELPGEHVSPSTRAAARATSRHWSIKHLCPLRAGRCSGGPGATSHAAARCVAPVSPPSTGARASSYSVAAGVHPRHRALGVGHLAVGRRRSPASAPGSSRQERSTARLRPARSSRSASTNASSVLAACATLQRSAIIARFGDVRPRPTSSASTSPSSMPRARGRVRGAGPRIPAAAIRPTPARRGRVACGTRASSNTARAVRGIGAAQPPRSTSATTRRCAGRAGARRRGARARSRVSGSRRRVGALGDVRRPFESRVRVRASALRSRSGRRRGAARRGCTRCRSRSRAARRRSGRSSPTYGLPGPVRRAPLGAGDRAEAAERCEQRDLHRRPPEVGVQRRRDAGDRLAAVAAVPQRGARILVDHARLVAGGVRRYPGPPLPPKAWHRALPFQVCVAESGFGYSDRER